MEMQEIKSALESATTELKTAMQEAKTGSAEAKAQAQELKDTVGTLNTELKARMDELEAKQNRPTMTSQIESKTLGQMFVDSEEFKSYQSSGCRGDSRTYEAKDITGTAGSALALAEPSRDPEVYRSIGGRRQLRIADLIPTVPVASGSVDIMRQIGFTNNASPQQAASSPSSAVGGGEFQPKSQSDLTFHLATVPVRTIAHWVPASRQVLSDAPQLRGIIDTELNYGLQLEYDEQILSGDGSGQNLTGILNDNEINDVGEIAAGTSSSDLPAAMIDHIRAAVTMCQLFEYYNINGLVLNPVDWQILETAKATDGHYLLFAFAATAGEPQTIWRIPVVVSNAMPAGKFLLGDWQVGSKLYEREGTTIRATESHADYFVRNGVAILAEQRTCLAVNRPKAFCKGSFEVASNGE